MMVEKMVACWALLKVFYWVENLALSLAVSMALMMVVPLADNLEPCWVELKVSMWAELMDEKLAVWKVCYLVGRLALELAVLMVWTMVE